MEMKKIISNFNEITKTHKKKIIGILIVLALIPVTSAVYEFMFEIKGVVTSTDKSTITVANFYRTQTIDLEGIPINTTILPGDRVFVQKNIQGNIIDVTVRSSDTGNHMYKDGGRKHR